MDRIFIQQTVRLFFLFAKEKGRSSLLVFGFLIVAVAAFAQQEKRITGTVTDEQNEPLVGVSVVIPNSATGTVTDLSGKYVLMIPSEKKELQFSYIGYETQTLPIPVGNVLNIQMKPDVIGLNEAVVIGYGTQRKSDLTGSITNVNSKDFNTGLIG